MKKVIYSAIFGGKDRLRPPRVVDSDYDYICFTDSDKVKSDVWDVRVLKEDVHPFFTAKRLKVLPHTVLSDYDYSVWVDGKAVQKRELDGLRCPIGFFNHPWRKCIYDEAKACMDKDLDDPTIISQFIGRLLREKYPEKNGLIHGSVIFRDHNDVNVVRAMDAWWDIVKNGPIRDQLSFNYIAWKQQLQFSYLGNIAQYFKIEAHRKKSKGKWKCIYSE